MCESEERGDNLSGNWKEATTACRLKLEGVCWIGTSRGPVPGCRPFGCIPRSGLSSLVSPTRSLWCCPPSRVSLPPRLPPGFCSKPTCDCALWSHSKGVMSNVKTNVFKNGFHLRWQVLYSLIVSVS